MRLNEEMLSPADAGRWSRDRACHLLRRTGFGCTAAEIARVHADGLNKSVTRIVAVADEPTDFVAESESLRQTALASGNIADSKMWWLHRMLRSNNPLAEKLTLLWHNHFATSFAKVQSVEAMLAQNATFRQYAAGDFGKLLAAMSRDVAMLLWLDGNGNKKRQPNENFARELFELFALGVGNYTEADIQQAARAFTGWHVRNKQFWFDSAQHDDGSKTVFGNRGRFDGSDIIAMCLKHPACSAFIATKLLRCFATDQPTAPAIAAVASRLRVNDMHIGKTLATLFASEYFYSDGVRSSLIKSPVDLVVGTLRTLDVHGDKGNAAGPNLVPTFMLLAELGQDLFEPPTVKGWEGGRQWVSSASHLVRIRFASQITAGEPFGRSRFTKDLAENIRSESGQTCLQAVSQQLFGRRLPEQLERKLERVWNDSSTNPREKVAELVYLMLSLPEYQMA